MKVFGRCLFLLCTMLSLAANAQTASTFSGGAHGESLAHTGSVYQGVMSIYGNIAGIAYVEGTAMDVSYDGRFNLAELSTASVSAVYGGKFGSVGILASRFGFDSYSENKLGIAYARKLGSGFSIGGMLDILQYNADGFQGTNKITFEAGIYNEVSSRVHIGLHIFSPGTVRISQVQELPTRVSLGVKYFASKKAAVIVDLTKIAERDLEFKVAVDYALHSKVGLRAGSNFTQSTFHFGSYYSIGEDIRLAAAYSYNNVLGSTPSISLTYGGFVSMPSISEVR